MKEKKGKLDIRGKFISARRELNRVLIERSEEIDLVLTALLCNEHPLLVGPPGTAKSMLLDGISSWMKVDKFDYLLTKFTDPMELFGPVDITALKQRKAERVVDGMLPTVQLAFLDEIFKSSSAILNTTLKILNERTFVFGKQRFKCPLICCLAASNEYPHDMEGGKELGALFDRFLLRKTVKPIRTREGREQMLTMAGMNDKEDDEEDYSFDFDSTLTIAELQKAQEQAQNLPVAVEAKDCLIELIDHLGEKDGIHPGDRRIMKSVKALKAFAFLRGSEEVSPDDFEILSHTLWNSPKDADQTYKTISHVAKPIGMKVTTLLQQVAGLTKATDEISCIEAIKKLKDIKSQLKDVGEDPRRDRAIRYIDNEIKVAQRKLTGLKDDDVDEEVD